MQFIGLGSFYADRNSMCLAATHVSDISAVTLSNAKFDCLYFSTDLNLAQYENGMPKHWQKTNTNDNSTSIDVTLLMTDFSNTCNASSIGFDLSGVRELVIQKRLNKTGENWNDFLIQKITSTEDFKFTFYDRFCSARTPYQYRIAAVTDDTEIDLNTIADIYSDFSGWYLADAEGFYGSKFNLERDLSRNTASTSVTTLSGRYPFIAKNGALNYTSGNISGLFIECQNGHFDTTGSFTYRNSFYDFLTNGMPKFLKFDTGESMLVQIGDQITQSENGVLHAPTTSFDFTEIENAQDYNSFKKYGFLPIGGRHEHDYTT